MRDPCCRSAGLLENVALTACGLARAVTMAGLAGGHAMEQGDGRRLRQGAWEGAGSTARGGARRGSACRA